ncbi:hypothetical protein LPUS_02658 [Lasallia pustulata]|uniref:Uncharacterized protein n=1 Tax=Lasallia pustulata TaxID=136370 RepID=A0A1W5CT18_9LECA|nr:hypothetical protein LPUS_02658 [Lasallia pustulata]
MACLKHDLRVIRTRSQDLKDHEISIYQKALATLMTNDEDLIPAIELYAEEILGLKLLRPAEKDGVLRQAIETRRLVTEKVDLKGSQLRDINPKLHRLWDLYQNAKEDFLSTPEAKWHSYTSSAKFLRDTAENCISYIESKQHLNQDRQDVASASGNDSAEEMLKELRITAGVAKDAAEKGSGGKKRRFDIITMEGVPSAPRSMREETARKRSTCHTVLPTLQKTRPDDDDQRQRAGHGRRDVSQDYVEHLATLAHCRETRIAKTDRERSASPKRVYGYTFDERDYRFHRSRVPGYQSKHQGSEREWRRSEAEDYRPSYYRSGDKIGRRGAEDYNADHNAHYNADYHQSYGRQEMRRAEQHGSSYCEPARRERSGVEDYGFSCNKPGKGEKHGVIDSWRPSN